MQIPSNIGVLIRNWRMSKRLSQTKAATVLKTEQSRLSRIETGKAKIREAEFRAFAQVCPIPKDAESNPPNVPFRPPTQRVSKNPAPTSTCFEVTTEKGSSSPPGLPFRRSRRASTPRGSAMRVRSHPEVRDAEGWGGF